MFSEAGQCAFRNSDDTSPHPHPLFFFLIIAMVIVKRRQSVVVRPTSASSVSPHSLRTSLPWRYGMG